MKKYFVCLISVLFLLAMMAGCSTAPKTEPAPTTQTIAVTEAPTTAPTEIPTEAATEAPAEEPTEAPEASTEPIVEETEAPVVYEKGTPSYYTYEVYAEQIGRYYDAISERWEEGKYFENDMSALPYYYYEGDPLENVGFGYVDLDNDGSWELVIGAILNAEQDPAVFEVWTLVDGKPVMLAQGGTRNRYVLQYVAEDGMWYIANEASNSAYSFATYYLMLNEGEIEVVQGVLFDALANEQNPWFMTFDLDWDASNDDSIDEETANAILESNRKFYTALEYIPYSSF